MSKREKKKEKSTRGWIYIGADCEKLNWCKVGKTDGDLKTRHRSAQNPNFFIYGAFQIRGTCGYTYSKEVLAKIESSIHDQLMDRDCDCSLHAIKHFSTGNYSECYRVNPETMMRYVEKMLVDSFPQYVSTNLYNEIDENYRYGDVQWWMDGNFYGTGGRHRSSSSRTERTPRVRYYSNRRREGIDLLDGYSVSDTLPLLSIDEYTDLDLETGQLLEHDGFDDDEF